MTLCLLAKSFSKPQITLLLFFKFLIPSKEIGRFHKKKEREEIPSKKKEQKKEFVFFFVVQIGKLDNSFLPLSSKENLLTCRLEGAHQWLSSEVLWGCVLSSPRKIIPVQGASTVCMRDTYYSQKNFPFSSQCTDEIPLGFWFIQGYFFSIARVVSFCDGKTKVLQASVCVQQPNLHGLHSGCPWQRLEGAMVVTLVFPGNARKGQKYQVSLLKKQ